MHNALAAFASHSSSPIQIYTPHPLSQKRTHVSFTAALDRTVLELVQSSDESQPA